MDDLISECVERFVEAEFPGGRPVVSGAPRIAAVGTVAARGLASPLLREQLANVHVQPASFESFGDPDALFADASWDLALVLSPYKRLVAARCAALTPTAAASGVVDTLLHDERTNGLRVLGVSGPRVLGVNTNAYAAGMALRHLAGTTTPHQVLILGTGAAARSVVLGVRRIYPQVAVLFAGRSPEGVERIVADVGFGSRAPDLSSTRPDAVVNATTVGETNDTSELAFDLQSIFRPGVRYFDLNNRPSALQSTALAAGCVVASGVVMQILTNALRACLLIPDP